MSREVPDLMLYTNNPCAPLITTTRTRGKVEFWVTSEDKSIGCQLTDGEKLYWKGQMLVFHCDPSAQTWEIAAADAVNEQASNYVVTEGQDK